MTCDTVVIVTPYCFASVCIVAVPASYLIRIEPTIRHVSFVQRGLFLILVVVGISVRSLVCLSIKVISRCCRVGSVSFESLCRATLRRTINNSRAVLGRFLVFLRFRLFSYSRCLALTSSRWRYCLRQALYSSV
jgi:hypothetical protein